MKTILLTIFTLIISSSINAQSENINNKTATDSFIAQYNAGNYKSIFASFSSEMKAALPIDQTILFLSGLQLQAGKILSREFLKYEQTSALYKTKFEKTTFTVSISIDESKNINGFFIKPYTEDTIVKSERNKTKMILPFNEEWTVFWGGDTKELNYHVEHPAQKNAFDLVITDDKGKSYKTDGKTNEDYYAFGKDIIAPCDGEIVLVVDGIKDNIPGILNPIYIPGNTVIIKTANNEYIFLAHFKQNSIKVKLGQKVKQGQLLGQCGNSGNSSEAHLHFHIMNTEDMNTATGIKCYFESIQVNGEMKNDYSPIRKEKITNKKK